MKVNLRTRYFLWLVLLLLIFIAVQALIYGAVEILTLSHHAELDRKEQLMEVVVGVGMDIVLLPFLALAAWWISSHMIRPLSALARTAEEIGQGRIDERVDTSSMPDDEMRSLAETLNHAFDRYTETIKKLDRFSGDASHQMRTPLASIRTEAELGLTQPRSVAEYQDVLGSILEDVARLSHLTEQLMMMARLDSDAQSREFTRLDPAVLIRETAVLYGEAYRAEGMRLETELIDDCRIMGNEDLVREVVQNLLDNALRYAGSSALVRVALTRDNGMAVLSVMDTGPGIPADQAEAVFERFHQVQPSSAQGSGLGLALAAEIVRIHGGTIELVSHEGWGAVFEIRLKES